MNKTSDLFLRQYVWLKSTLRIWPAEQMRSLIVLSVIGWTMEQSETLLLQDLSIIFFQLIYDSDDTKHVQHAEDWTKQSILCKREDERLQRSRGLIGSKMLSVARAQRCNSTPNWRTKKAKRTRNMFELVTLNFPKFCSGIFQCFIWRIGGDLYLWWQNISRCDTRTD